MISQHAAVIMRNATQCFHRLPLRVRESRSAGKCLFVMPDGKDLEAIRRKITGK
jgi:hypothetical protein